MSLKSKITILFMVGIVASLFLCNIAMAAIAMIGVAFTQGFHMTGFAFINIDIIGACERIVREAESLAGQNYAYNLKRKTGALDFITSPENGSVDATLISQGKKYATLKVYYDQRTKPCQVITDCDSNVCDPGATPVRKQQLVNISRCLKTPVREYSNEDMVALCKDTEQFMRDRMLSDVRAAHEQFSVMILGELDNQIGTNDEWDGTSTAAGQYKPIQLLATESGQRIPKPGNWAEVMLDYSNNQLTGQPAVIGQGNLEMFWKLHGYSCCNATTPYGEADLAGDARVYIDQMANSVLGPQNFIVAAYRAVHLLTFNENRNINISTPIQQHRVIADPLGYPFDWNLDFYFDNCTKTWKSQLSLLWGTFNVFQADSFGADGEGESPDSSPDCNDELDGMLGVFGYTATAS